MDIKAILTGRLTQILVKLLGLAAAYAAGKGFDLGLGDSAALAVFVAPMVAFGYDIVVHRIKHGTWIHHAGAGDDDVGPPSPFSTPRLACLVMVIMPFALAGCFSRPPAVKAGAELRTKAVMSYDRAMALSIQHYLEQCVAHLDTRIAWDLEKLDKNADAQGNIKAADAKVFMQKIMAERDAGRAKISEQVNLQSQAVAAAKQEVITYLRLDALLNEFEEAGLDKSQLVNGVMQILQDSFSKLKPATGK